MLSKFSRLPRLPLASRSFAGLTKPTKNLNNPKAGEYYQALEFDYGCHNYNPLPIVVGEAKGVHVWDVEGNKYYDFISAIGSVNQGHCHPKILEAMYKQAQKVTCVSRAFHNHQLGPVEKYLAELFKFDKVLLMNTGVEACESAIKIARRWGYVTKGIPDNEATILFANNHYHGRLIGTCAASDDPIRINKFGPWGGLRFDLVPFDNAESLEAAFLKNKNIAAFMIEPIQGEGGIVLPSPGYIKKVRDLCTKYNVLLISDEVQTGLGRTGKMLCIDWDNVKPDMVTLGKSLSGGFYPISAVLADNAVMNVINPGEHGSTFGGNPLAGAIAKASMEVIVEEGLVENSRKMGDIMYKGLDAIKRDFIVGIRGGRGLFSGIELIDSEKINAFEICKKLKDNGLVTNVTKKRIIRMVPPLIINETQMEEALSIVKKTLMAV